MKSYVLLDFDTYQAYQEADMGMVTGYYSVTGELIFTQPPQGHHGGIVVDPNPPRLDWMQ